MKKNNIIIRTVLIVFLTTVFVVANICFLGNIFESQVIYNLGDLEYCFYMIAYILSDCCVAIAIVEIINKRNKLTVALNTAFMYTVIVFIYDIILTTKRGIALEGTFNMIAFMILDVMILVCIALNVWKNSRMLTMALAVLSVTYVVGEILGYPLETFDDWDEFMLNVGLLSVYICNIVLRFASKNTETKKLN